MGRASAQSAIDLVEDCSRCVGLCCVALEFARSADFAINKPAGHPCPNLDEGFRCQIHARLRTSGFPGCVTYTCFGAGQRITASFEGRDWRGDPEVATAMFALLPRTRAIHELLWLLRSALAEDLPDGLRARLEVAHAQTDQVARMEPEQVRSLDVGAHRDLVNAELLQASAYLRGPIPGRDLRGAELVGAHLARADLRRASLRGARLMGADLTGADLRRSDLTGTDLRAAKLHRADLRGALFVSQAQLESAHGSVGTRLPVTLTRPSHWGPG
jgi:hypothetical protein